MAGLKAVSARCAEEGGLTKATLGELREELGYKKLGKWVPEEIAEALAAEELGRFPLATLDPLYNTEPRQNQTVWLYARDNSTRSEIITVVLDPERRDVRSILDGLADGRLAALTPEEKLERIREIASA